MEMAKPIEVAHIAVAACAAPVAPVAVVLGAHADASARSLAGLPAQLLFNRAWPEGMASSIRLAAAWADQAGCDGALGLSSLFPRRTFPRLLALAGDGGGQDIIRAEPAVTAIDWPDGALDIDTEADVATLGG